MPGKIWECGCIDDEDKEMLMDGIHSELYSIGRSIERREKMAALDEPGGHILLNSAKNQKNKLLKLKRKVDSMTLCEIDSD